VNGSPAAAFTDDPGAPPTESGPMAAPPPVAASHADVQPG
jgi:hypothetical protein